MPKALPAASTTRKGVDPSKFMGSSFAAGKQLEKRVETNEKKITLIKNILKMRQQSENIGKTLDGIHESVEAIAETTDLQYKHDLDQAEDKRIQDEQDDSKKREKGLEKVSSGIAKGADKILAPVKSFMSKMWDFLKIVLLGAGVMKMLDWFGKKENTEKISSLFRFFKDWWPAIVAGLIAFASGLLGPVGVLIGVVALLAWGIPKIIAAVKSIFGMGDDVEKIVSNESKGVDNLLKNGEVPNKELESLESKLKGSTPETSPETGDGSEVPQELSGAQQPMDQVQEPPGYKEGGFVQGPGGVDKVPARLTAGEFVMSKGAVQRYGTDTLAGMNAAGKGTNTPVNSGYNGGGLVRLTDHSVDNRSHTTRIGGSNISRNVEVNPTQNILPYEGKEYSKKFQFGGSVTGRGGKDNVPAKLTAGEYVMSRSAVNTFGANTFAAMNSSGGGTNVPVERHYESGGYVEPVERYYQGGGYVAPPSSNERMVPPSQPKKGRIKVVPMPLPSSGGGGGVSAPTVKKIPPFSVSPGGGTHKEQVLGIRR